MELTELVIVNFNLSVAQANLRAGSIVNAKPLGLPVAVRISGGHDPRRILNEIENRALKEFRSGEKPNAYVSGVYEFQGTSLPTFIPVQFYKID